MLVRAGFCDIVSGQRREAVTESIIYAAEHTGNEYYRSRLTDTIRWTLNAYLHYDGEYGWGKKGLVNERFCYTDALLAERFADGSPAATWVSRGAQNQPPEGASKPATLEEFDLL